MRRILIAVAAVAWACACTAAIPQVQQWQTCEIVLQSAKVYDNGYTDVDVWAMFQRTDGTALRRPAFWDGDRSWKIRFAPIDSNGLWQYRTFSSDESDQGLHGRTGTIRSVPYMGSNRLLANGLLKMSAGMRNVVHHNGRPFLLVADTPWALPFRATTEQVRIYAQDRHAKGFNAALLMTVQPDMRAEGPDARNTPLGFARGFSDLPDGHINQLIPSYFQCLDSLITILIDHEIVPVYQPVFHGFGWKGLSVLGKVVKPAEYVRYCKYLLARYGSTPAMWLLCADSNGKEPGVPESGEMMEQWDCYHQPTGIHYNPCDDYLAEWAKNDSNLCFHENKSYQHTDWLDFQWAQTGHGGEHLYHKVERMYENLPVKASANGEPTYEGMNGGQAGLGWWQGEESWMQLMSGATMGVVYGAAGLWQWQVTGEEPGWDAWCSQKKSWRDALNLEGSRYVGMLAGALRPYDFTDMIKMSERVAEGQVLSGCDDRFFISFLKNGGRLAIRSLPSGLDYEWFNPKTGERTAMGKTSVQQIFTSPDDNPWVLIIGK